MVDSISKTPVDFEVAAAIVGDAFCEFVGTGGTFAGISRFLKAKRPAISCYIIEPAGAAVLAGQPLVDPAHRIQGGGYSMTTLPLIDPALIDGHLVVSDVDAIDGARRLARQEGIIAGFSAGACLVAAEQLLRGRHAGQTIAIVLADSGMKYLSTDLWGDTSFDRLLSGHDARAADVPDD